MIRCIAVSPLFVERIAVYKSARTAKILPFYEAFLVELFREKGRLVYIAEFFLFFDYRYA